MVQQTKRFGSHQRDYRFLGSFLLKNLESLSPQQFFNKEKK